MRCTRTTGGWRRPWWTLRPRSTSTRSIRTPRNTSARLSLPWPGTTRMIPRWGLGLSLDNSLFFFFGVHCFCTSTKYIYIYIEYHCVCPLVGIGTLPPPLSPARGEARTKWRGGGGTLPCGLRARGWGSPNSYDWRNSLALCLLFVYEDKDPGLCVLSLKYFIPAALGSPTIVLSVKVIILNQAVFSYEYR